MEIIDAHIHYADWEGFNRAAEASGQVNTAAHVAETFRRNHIVMGVVMGAGGGESGVCSPMLPNLAGPCTLEHYGQPDNIAYCAGIDSDLITPENTAKSLELFEQRLKTPQCVGLKIYPGYHKIYPNDPRHHPFFELAARYNVPVVFHTGDTAGNRGHVKYAHPLTVDEVAVDFPETTFVLAHCGNPWIVDAIEVAAKNDNVRFDLSGLAVGRFDPAWFLDHYRGYLDNIRNYLVYLSDWSKPMYGSDYPLVNIDDYIPVIRSLVPEEEQEKVFHDNALNTFSKLRGLLKK